VQCADEATGLPNAANAIERFALVGRRQQFCERVEWNKNEVKALAQV
jgi:hypothetical protein